MKNQELDILNTANDVLGRMEKVNERTLNLANNLSSGVKFFYRALKAFSLILLIAAVYILFESNIVATSVNYFSNLSENWQIAIFAAALQIISGLAVGYIFFKLGQRQK